MPAKFWVLIGTYWPFTNIVRI